MVFGGRWCPIGCGKTVIVYGGGRNISLKCEECGLEWRRVKEYEEYYESFPKV